MFSKQRIGNGDYLGNVPIEIRISKTIQTFNSIWII